MDSDNLDLLRVWLTVRVQHGQLLSAERKAIAKALRNSPVGMVRIDEAIVTHLGPSRSSGLPVELDIRLEIYEEMASWLLGAAIAKAIAPIVKVLSSRMTKLVARVYREDQEPITYIINSPEDMKALDAMPADYEMTMRTRARTVVWRDGGWERHEPMTRITINDVDFSDQHNPVVRLSRVPTRHWVRVFDEYIRWAKGGPIPEAQPGFEPQVGDTVIQTDVDVKSDRLVISLRSPYTTYEDIRTFVDEAIGYANALVALATARWGGEA